MSFNSSDCVWSDSSSTCLGPERCIRPQITGRKGNFPLVEYNEISGKCFPPTPSGASGGLGIGRVTKQRAVAIVASAITDLPTHPP